MEDAEQELRIALYSAVEQIDQVDMEAKVVNYLVKAVKSRFIYLYGKHRKRIESETAILEDMNAVLEKTVAAICRQGIYPLVLR